MKKWIAAVVLMALILGIFFLFYSVSDGDDIRYTSPDQVQNRPEVERELLKKFAQSKKLQVAALEVARRIQVAISFPELARETYKQLSKAGSCFDALYGDNAHVPSREIEALVVNSYSRSKAYLQYNVNLSGYMYTVEMPSVKDCHFDVNSLEN